MSFRSGATTCGQTTLFEDPDLLAGSGAIFAVTEEPLDYPHEESTAVETLFKLGFACFLLGDHAEDIVGRRDLHGRNASLLLRDGGATLGPFYGIASTDVYGADDHTARTTQESVEHTSGYAGLMRVGMECGREPLPAVTTGLEMAALLGRALGATAERAQERGWYRPVIDEIVFVVGR